MKTTSTKDVIIIYDNDVDKHYPSHFSNVYGELIPEKYGRKTSIFAPAGNSTKHRVIKLKNKELTHSVLNKMKNILFSDFLSLIRIIRSEEYIHASVVIIHNNPILALLFLTIAKHKNKKIIYRITHLKCEEYADTSSVKKIMSSLCQKLRGIILRRSDFNIYMSPNMAEYLGAKIDSRNDVIESMINLQQNENISNADIDVKRIKNTITSYAPGIWLCYIGTISGKRHLTFILDLLQKLNEETNQNFNLMVLGIGSDSDLKALQAEVKIRSLHKNIALEKPISEDSLTPALQLMDIGISPYFYEKNFTLNYNSPVKLLNYLCAGIPVVGSDIPDQTHVISKTHSGYTVDNSVQSYIDAIQMILENFESGKYNDQWRLNIKHWLNENRSIDVAAKKLENIISEVCSHNSL